MVSMETFKTRQDWLAARRGRIGGSDAAAILGLNPYKTNVQLWEEKTGRRTAPDISGLPYVKYGTEAEEPLRELFGLDFPEYTVMYEEGNMWLNDAIPWGHASLDGWLLDQGGRRGIWECKTTEIMRAGQKDLWKGRIPDNYYIQLLHYFLITGFDFAILKGQLKFDIDGEIWLQTKHYKIERSEVADDIEFLKEKESEFWQCIQQDKPPALILPPL